MNDNKEDIKDIIISIEKNLVGIFNRLSDIDAQLNANRALMKANIDIMNRIEEALSPFYKKENRDK